MTAGAIFGAITGLIALILSASISVWLKLLMTRSFNAIDERLRVLSQENNKNFDSLSKKMEGADQCIRTLEQEIVRVEALTQSVVEVKDKIVTLEGIRSDLLERLNEYIRRGDFIRDTQTLLNQIEIIYKKIDYVDAKIDKLRDK